MDCTSSGQRQIELHSRGTWQQEGALWLAPLPPAQGGTKTLPGEDALPAPLQLRGGFGGAAAPALSSTSLEKALIGLEGH